MPFDGSVTEVRIVLERARRLLEERGVCFGSFRTEDGRLCSLSAISAAASSSTWVSSREDLLLRACAIFRAANGIADWGRIEHWHDRRPAGIWFLRPSRRAQILAAFDRAIALA